MAKLTTDQREALPSHEFAFAAQRKEPLENASHVRNAIARFSQVHDVSDAERDLAWKRIQSAARTFGVAMSESGWRDHHPTAGRS
jgi:hypothetical protein